MKRTIALLLALLMLLTASFAAAEPSADPFTEGFNPEELLHGITEIMSSEVGIALTAEPSESAGNYTFKYNGEEFGAYAVITHVDESGTASEGEKNNHASVYFIFSYTESDGEETLQTYLSFWVALSCSLLKYTCGGEEMMAYASDLYTAMNNAVAAEDYSASYTCGGYTATVVISPVSESTYFLGTTVDIPGLY